MTRISYGFTGAHDDFETYQTGAKKAQERGFDGIWFAEDYFFRDTFTTGSAIAAQTDNLDIGVFVNPYTRHPALTAVSAASLDEIAGGNVRIAMGAGPDVVMKRIVDYESPLWTVKESVEVIRGLLKGEESYNGNHFDFEDISLGSCDYMPYMDSFTPPRDRIPIHIGAVGPQMLKMAGDVGDGLAVSVGSPPALVEESLERVDDGLAMSDRDRDEFDVTVFLFAADEITSRVREYAAFTVGAVFDLETLTSVGIEENVAEEITETFEDEGLEAASAVVPDEVAKKFALVGDREECHDQLDRYVAAGASEIVMLHMGPGEPEATIEIGATWDRS